MHLNGNETKCLVTAFVRSCLFGWCSVVRRYNVRCSSSMALNSVDRNTSARFLPGQLLLRALKVFNRLNAILSNFNLSAAT